eukprot:10731799-Karenia_brevis.AAC.1
MCSETANNCGQYHLVILLTRRRILTACSRTVEGYTSTLANKSTALITMSAMLPQHIDVNVPASLNHRCWAP